MKIQNINGRDKIILTEKEFDRNMILWSYLGVLAQIFLFTYWYTHGGI